MISSKINCHATRHKEKVIVLQARQNVNNSKSEVSETVRYHHPISIKFPTDGPSQSCICCSYAAGLTMLLDLRPLWLLWGVFV